ncbi:glycosyltransferase family 39 protein, partial [Mizugakiibacter sediminis]|uniref:glycosyltransferase family 39 protein n=1 Tax=Mizugakiibacter sediminis TaxID=1475481 RepID=UPI000AA3A656
MLPTHPRPVERPPRARPPLALAWLAPIALIALRLLYLRSYPFNSDEPQHLHVAWAWARGLLPYRDVFDNHGPLFGLLHAPLLRLLGERADALAWMRASMLAWYLLALASTWRLARALYGEGVARAASLLVALYPSFFLVSGQFRTDDLWMALWLAALAVALAGPPRAWRGFAAGLLAGAALSVSQKTLLLLGCAGVAAAVTWA